MAGPRLGLRLPAEALPRDTHNRAAGRRCRRLGERSMSLHRNARTSPIRARCQQHVNDVQQVGGSFGPIWWGSACQSSAPPRPPR